MYEAAIDPAPDRIGLALADSGRVLVKRHIPMRARDAARLADWVATVFAEVNVTVDQVRRWSVGAGPGSFTALRQVAALVSGWTFGRPEVETRCVPGAAALASGGFPHPEAGLKVLTVYDGRNSELLYYEIEFVDHSWVSTVRIGIMNAAAVSEHRAELAGCALVGYECGRQALERLLPPELKLRTLESGDPVALLDNRAYPFDGDLTKLVYIRPAVYLPGQP